ncbi:MAG: hypothetical protein H0X52_02075 [Gemmatimonadetes bacterium]|nr:hypothetical protein [Gemmatimonadota bacterium]
MVNHGTITLRSGIWTWSHKGDGLILLRNTEKAQDRLRMQRPEAEYTNEIVAELARDPDFRIWHDDQGVRWRLMIELQSHPDAGSGNPDLPEPPDQLALVFSGETQELKTAVPVRWDLGDATDEELLELRHRAEQGPWAP